MRKPNKKINAIKQRKALKRNARTKATKKMKTEKIRARKNSVARFKEELFEKWVAAVGDKFDGEHK